MGVVKYFKKELKNKTLQALASTNERAIVLCKGSPGKLTVVSELNFNKDVYLNNLEQPEFIPYYSGEGNIVDSIENARLSNFSGRTDAQSGRRLDLKFNGNILGIGSKWNLSKNDIVFMPQFTSLSIVKTDIVPAIKRVFHVTSAGNPNSSYLNPILNYSNTLTYSRWPDGNNPGYEKFIKTLDYVKINKNYSGIVLMPDESLIIYLGETKRSLDGVNTTASSSANEAINMIIEGYMSIEEVPYESTTI